LSNIEKLLAVMARLRDPQNGCPWDRAQTLASIVPHTIEETYEVADAIERGDMTELRDELGDLLFQVVFYARIAEEQGEFAFADVVDAIAEKLIRRHPHVFADVTVADAQAQSAAWEAHKAQERRHKGDGVLDGVARALPAITRAVKLQKRAARVGFDWPDVTPVFDKVREELEEVRVEIEQGAPIARIEDEIGDLFFACTNLARLAGIDSETALRRANDKFERRFRAMEAFADRPLTSLSLDEWEALWERAKSTESR
jgi:MazG family protein